MTATEIAARVAAGELSAEEVVADALARIAARPELNAVITVCEEQALARARAGVSGALAGVPVLVKDLIDTAGVRTTYGSSIYADHVPERSAPAVTALEAAGRDRRGQGQRRRVRLGRVRPEHASTATPSTRPRPTAWPAARAAATRRRWRPGMVPLALGTDTGGSVRMPAAACGVVGLKTGARRGADRGRLPAGGELRHRRPDGAHGGRLRAGPRRAHRHRGPGAARSRACASAC